MLQISKRTMMFAQLAALIMLQGGSAYNYKTNLMRNRQKSTILQGAEDTVHATTQSQNLELSRSHPQLLMRKGSQRGGRAALQVSAHGSASQVKSREEIETKLDSNGISTGQKDKDISKVFSGADDKKNKDSSSSDSRSGKGKVKWRSLVEPHPSSSDSSSSSSSKGKGKGKGSDSSSSSEDISEDKNEEEDTNDAAEGDAAEEEDTEAPGECNANYHKGLIAFVEAHKNKMESAEKLQAALTQIITWQADCINNGFEDDAWMSKLVDENKCSSLPDKDAKRLTCDEGSECIASIKEQAQHIGNWCISEGIKAFKIPFDMKFQHDWWTCVVDHLDDHCQ
jgi:hypothetical protein